MNSFLIRLYAFSFLDELMLIYPFYAVMFVDYGMSGLEVSILFATWSGTCVVLEVPSGALADRFSRKWVIVGPHVWLCLMGTISGLLGVFHRFRALGHRECTFLRIVRSSCV